MLRHAAIATATAKVTTSDQNKTNKEVIVLADNIPIEKLSLCKGNRKATFSGHENEILADGYYEEIASIPMPQET